MGKRRVGGGCKNSVHARAACSCRRAGLGLSSVGDVVQSGPESGHGVVFVWIVLPTRSVLVAEVWMHNGALPPWCVLCGVLGVALGREG